MKVSALRFSSGALIRWTFSFDVSSARCGLCASSVPTLPPPNIAFGPSRAGSSRPASRSSMQALRRCPRIFYRSTASCLNGLKSSVANGDGNLNTRSRQVPLRADVTVLCLDFGVFFIEISSLSSAASLVKFRNLVDVLSVYAWFVWRVSLRVSSSSSELHDSMRDPARPSAQKVVANAIKSLRDDRARRRTSD